jgi:hypothetical protein
MIRDQGGVFRGKADPLYTGTRQERDKDAATNHLEKIATIVRKILYSIVDPRSGILIGIQRPLPVALAMA